MMTVPNNALVWTAAPVPALAFGIEFERFGFD